MILRVAAVAVLMGAFALNASAARVVGLHEAEVPTVDKEQRAQTKAIQDAMRRVLIKLTGNSEVETLPVAQDLIRNARNLMLQYRYTIPAQARGDLPLLLWVRFDEQAVDQALRRAGVYLWGNERPATLLWLAMPTSEGVSLIGSEDLSGVRDMVQQEARRRGIPVVLPLLDLEDASAISARQVVAMDASAIEAASMRYGTPATLAGTIEMIAENRWHARWVLLSDGRPKEWQAKGDLQQIMSAGIDKSADELYYRYAVAVADNVEAGLQLTITGVSELSDYASLQHYLDNLSDVTRIQLLSAENDRVTYFVSARTGVEGLEQSFALGKRLIKEGEGLYRLLP